MGARTAGAGSGERGDDVRAQEIDHAVLSDLCRYAIGDLGPARRHVRRLLSGELTATPAVLLEVEASLERCVERLEINKEEPCPKT